jgi:hypothetical protein
MVSDLRVQGVAGNSIQLAWTAVGDDGRTGRASLHDLRYSANPITESNFPNALSRNLQAPRVSGQAEADTVTGLSSGTIYYFGLRVSDDAGNHSQIATVSGITTPSVSIRGACCDPATGQCSIGLEDDCFDEWMGAGTTCSPEACKSFRAACCADNGSCTITFEDDCTDGDWMDGVESCSPSPCDPIATPGACCDAASGHCTLVLEDACDEDWMGEGTTCSPAACDSLKGACCDGAGNCTITFEDDCDDDWLGAATVCNSITCPPPSPGACCDESTGECEIATEDDCGETWRGAGTVCNATTCPPPVGACCDAASGHCTLVLEDACDEDWMGEGTTCSPVACDSLKAACCSASGICSLTFEDACSEDGWHGDATSCSPGLCPQPGSVRGLVYDQLRGAASPLVGVKVTVEDSAVFAWTDETGQYSLWNVPSGEQTIVIDRGEESCYDLAEEPVTVPSGGTVFKNIGLVVNDLDGAEPNECYDLAEDLTLGETVEAFIRYNYNPTGTFCGTEKYDADIYSFSPEEGRLIVTIAGLPVGCEVRLAEERDSGRPDEHPWESGSDFRANNVHGGTGYYTLDGSNDQDHTWYIMIYPTDRAKGTFDQTPYTLTATIE